MLPSKICAEEDLFPREITSWEKRDYGLLFYNEDNRDSYDSNHAVIFRDRVSDIDRALDDIVNFYESKGMKPIIYQSISNEGYFAEISQSLARHCFEYWTEEQKYMMLTESSVIVPSPEVEVRRIAQ